MRQRTVGSYTTDEDEMGPRGAEAAALGQKTAPSQPSARRW